MGETIWIKNSRCLFWFGLHNTEYVSIDQILEENKGESTRDGCLNSLYSMCKPNTGVFILHFCSEPIRK